MYKLVFQPSIIGQFTHNLHRVLDNPADSVTKKHKIILYGDSHHSTRVSG